MGLTLNKALKSKNVRNTLIAFYSSIVLKVRSLKKEKYKHIPIEAVSARGVSATNSPFVTFQLEQRILMNETGF